MDPVVVTISHSIGKDEVLKRLRPALGQAAQSFPVLKIEQEHWDGDRMDFRVRALGQSIAGNIRVGETDVRIEIGLPWLLAKFTSAIQKTITQSGRILLERK